MLAVAALAIVAGVTALPAAGDQAVPNCVLTNHWYDEGDNGFIRPELDATCNQPLPHDLVYRITTSDGTATAPADYEQLDTTAGASQGATELSVVVSIAGDTVDEPDETFTVALADPSGTVTFGPPATVTIVDDDGPPPPPVHCTAPDKSFPEGNSGNDLLTFQFTCDATITHDTVLHMKTADGTASADFDYVRVDGDGGVAAGATTVAGAVAIAGDTLAEPDETLTYTLSDPTGRVVFNTVTITILDDGDTGAPPSGTCLLLSDTSVAFSGTASTPDARSYAGPQSPLTMTNCGGAPIDVLARGTDATGAAGTWRLTNRATGGPIDSTCELGTDLFRAFVTLWYGDQGFGTYVTTADAPLLGSDLTTPFLLDAGAAKDFTPEVEMPCEDSAGVGTGSPMTMQMTFTAVSP